MIIKHQPVAIEGYPSSLYALALLLRDNNLQLHIPVAFTSSETLFDYQRSLIEQQLGTEIFDRYGMTERTISLIESNNHNGYYEAPGYSINEYLEDGEICTSLINIAFPLIRYRSNDVMEIFEATEDNPQIVVTKIEGRKEDYLCCKDGSRIMRLGFVFKGVKHIKYSQLIQDANGLLAVRIVPEKGFTDTDKKQVEQNLVQRIGNGNIDFNVELITEQDIKLSARGKYKFVINLMNVKTGGVIKKILGRADDFVICKDGSIVTRIDFVEGGKHIKACQWVQREKGKLFVYVVPDVGFTEQDKKYVLAETQKRVGLGNMDINVQVVALDQLIYSRRGKFKLIVNLMAKQI